MGKQVGGDDKIEIHLAWTRKRAAGINNSRPFFCFYKNLKSGILLLTQLNVQLYSSFNLQ